MAQVTISYRVCSQCHGVIPAGSDQIQNVSGRILRAQQSVEIAYWDDQRREERVRQEVRDVPEDFDGLDFCGTEHMVAYFAGLGHVDSPAQPLIDQPQDVISIATDTQMLGQLVSAAEERPAEVLQADPATPATPEVA